MGCPVGKGRALHHEANSASSTGVREAEWGSAGTIGYEDATPMVRASNKQPCVQAAKSLTACSDLLKMQKECGRYFMLARNYVGKELLFQVS